MPTDPATNPGSAPNGAGDAPAREGNASAGLGRELGGDLPCVVCGYNLRGLSVRSMCPECGTAVRATILSVVDPHASILRPITFPRLTATGVVLWAAGAVAVALMAWLPQVHDLLRALGVGVAARPSAAFGTMLALATSAVGSLALIRPHAGVPRSDIAMAGLATVLYAPLAWVLWRYHLVVEGARGQHYLEGWTPSGEMSRLLAVACVLIAVIIMLQRPNARLLVARSMVMRTGRVDRQTMYAMALAACVVALGALLGRLSPMPPMTLTGEVARAVGVVFIAFGSIMLTIGAVGSLLDCARIAGAIVIPKLTVRQVIREGRPARRSRLMRMIDPLPPAANGAAVRPSATGTTRESP